MDDQVIKEFMSKIYEELKELKEGQLQNRESIEIIAVQTELLTTNMERLESRFDVFESRFDVLESRFDGLESRFDVLESRFDRFETELRNIKEIVIGIEIT
jgi:chromosome segregation ATPase